MIDMTKEQMKEKFRRDTLLYWPIVLALHTLMLLVIAPYVRSAILAIVFIIVMIGNAIVYAMFIMVFWLPASYYSGLDVCVKCGEKAVKQVNRAKCLECGDVKDYAFESSTW